jgi:hypothetical protein
LWGGVVFFLHPEKISEEKVLVCERIQSEALPTFISERLEGVRITLQETHDALESRFLAERVCRADAPDPLLRLPLKPL